MAKPLERKAASIAELLEAVADIRSIWGTNDAPAEEIWFRGNAHRCYGLLPGIYRDHVAKYEYDELTLFETFKALAAPLVDDRPHSEWEWYFLAQHYGLPTRLLDWTENLFTALYFAVEPHAGGWDRPTFTERLSARRTARRFNKESPTVWVLEVGTLNQYSVAEDCVVVPGGPQLDEYLPASVATASTQNKFPVGVFPVRGSNRIVAQQGMFTVHGHERASIDKLSMDQSRKVKVASVVFDQNNVPRLWEELRLAGINRLSLFPDLPSVAPHICWLYQSSADPKPLNRPVGIRRAPRKKRTVKKKR